MEREDKDVVNFIEHEICIRDIESVGLFYGYGIRPSELFEACASYFSPEKLKRILCEKFGFDSWSQLKQAALSVDAH